jgi:hypothetical protein
MKFEAIQYARVSEEYLTALGLRLMKGRNFTADDRTGTQPVAIITESLARRLWPDRDALGQLLIRRRDTEVTRLLVVGVVADMKIGGARSPATPFVLLPLQQSLPAFNLTVIAHSSLGEAATLDAVKQAVWGTDAGLPVISGGSLKDRIDATAAIESFQTRVLAALGGLALVITLMGISGLVLRIVTAREVEFSVRQALGATQIEIARMLVVEQLRLILAGVVAGTLLAWVLAQTVRLPLFGVTANSPLPYLLTIAAMGLLSLASLAWPVLRAARTKPSRMLRA